jgi:predicted transcriptional regulator
MTGLRGGNLLFHLRKLQDSGTFLQRKEWGDYVITDKGYQILKMVVECHFRLIL